jgi:multicomponent Na+:H+ antiporter subunit E
MNSSEEQSRPAEPPVNGPGTLKSAISRAAGFFAFWLVLTGADAGDLAAGLAAAVAATLASLRLMPAQEWS